MDTENPIVFFDGVCNLCSKSVQFIIRHDPEHLFRFAPLQGQTAKRLLTNQQNEGQLPDSIVLWHKGQFYTRTDAALQVASKLQLPWRWLAVLKYVPRPLRDWAYNIIARHRYQWFGKQQTCWIPSPSLKALFMD